jgi:cell division protein FtsQ
MADSGDSYYMDIRGNVMPTDEFLMDICLATGNITRQYAQEHLIEIADYMNTHSTWKKEVQQVYVRSEKQIELIPSAGEHIIILGEPKDIKDKMDRLTIFYKEGLDKAGWNKYSTIDLNYAGQVVCTKRNKK